MVQFGHSSGNAKRPLIACYDEALKQKNLNRDLLIEFVKAIGCGDSNTLQTILGSQQGSLELNNDQKRALLNFSFNYNHFINNESGTVVTTAIQLAKKLDKKDVLNYLADQKEKLDSGVIKQGLFHHKAANRDDSTPQNENNDTPPTTFKS
ncbi:MAG: hypothetical protein Q8R83_06425 [Legionellaceae bacterium]|nr:hypothetical protein [Legionellaceae bacterium]